MDNFSSILVPLSSIAFFGFSGSLHCLGMCGPLVAACPGKSWPYFFFRALSYTIIGLVAGLFGHVFFRKILQISAHKTFFLIAAIAVVQIFFVLKGLKSGTQGSSFSNKLASLLMRYSPLPHSASLGIITAFLPCGFLYAAVMMSAALASPGKGALGMLVFAIVTSPILAGGRGLLSFLFLKKPRVGRVLSLILLSWVAIMSVKKGLSTGTEGIKHQSSHTLHILQR